MSGAVVVLMAVCVALLVLLAVRIQREKQALQRLETMIDSATVGKFVEQQYDEEVVSKLEEKFISFLSATEVSEKRMREEKDRIKTMISDVSHQTKTPLANLKLYTELLKEESLSSSAQENVEALYWQVDKLSFLIDTLVKLSRLESGIIKLMPAKNKVLALLHEIKVQYQSQAESKGLCLVVEGVDCTALFDLKWTLEAVGNIVDNAIKYTDAGTITIKVIPYELFMRIDISDTGIGIKQDERAKLFSRFYRSHDTANQNGLGIGLYLAREIISAEGGYIKAANNDKAGATFSVYLPSTS